MIVAVSLPTIPGKLAAAIVAAGALAILLAASRMDNRWERLFSVAFAMFVIWAAYFNAVLDANLSDGYHASVFLLLLSVGVVFALASVVRADASPRRFASLAIAYFLGIVWWEAVRSVACGNIVQFECTSRLGDLADRAIPDWLAFLILLGSVALLVYSWKLTGGQVAWRWIVLGFAAFVFFDATRAFRSMISNTAPQPSRGWAALDEFLTLAAAVAAWVMAARSREDRSTILLGSGLALFLAPSAWSSLQALIAS